MNLFTSNESFRGRIIHQSLVDRVKSRMILLTMVFLTRASGTPPEALVFSVRKCCSHGLPNNEKDMHKS
jgi:hypothetical protein